MEQDLKDLINQIPLNTETELPFSQGMAIKTVIDTYNIPVIKWGYYQDIIAVATKKQVMVWKDEGWRLVFIGLIDKED